MYCVAYSLIALAGAAPDTGMVAPMSNQAAPALLVDPVPYGIDDWGNNQEGAFRLQQALAEIEKVMVGVLVDRETLKRDGFTIVELVVVAGLAGIVAAIAVPRVPRMVAVYDAANMASQIALDLRLARERAVTTNAKARLSFSTTAYQPQRESPAGSGTYISDGAQQNLANGITVTTNPSTPIFDSRGLTTQAYTLTITNAYGDSKTITVSVIGRINVS